MLRCPQCNGNKVVSPLGHMQKQCIKCEGVGYVEKSAIDFTFIDQSQDAVVEAEVVDHKKVAKEAMVKRLAEARAKRKAKVKA